MVIRGRSARYVGGIDKTPMAEVGGVPVEVGPGGRYSGFFVAVMPGETVVSATPIDRSGGSRRPRGFLIRVAGERAAGPSR